MHMEYQIISPDHDFIVGSRHKLIPSVIGDMEVAKRKFLTNDAASYSGSTYIAITSAKHSAFLAFHYLRDMDQVRTLPEFTDSFQDKSSKEKKVMIVSWWGSCRKLKVYKHYQLCN